MNPADVHRLGLEPGASVDLRTAIDDGIERRVAGLRVVPYDIPPGCVAAYYPEINPLVPLSHRDVKSRTPGYKAVPVTVSRSA